MAPLARDWLIGRTTSDDPPGTSVSHIKLVISWSMDHRQDRQPVIRAVGMAILQRQDTWSVILQSDRDSQFTSADYKRFLIRNTLVCCIVPSGIPSMILQPTETVVQAFPEGWSSNFRSSAGDGAHVTLGKVAFNGGVEWIRRF